MDNEFVIPLERFDDPMYIEQRLAGVDARAQGSLRSALKYLYLTDGPINLPRERKQVAEFFLEPRESVIIRWLQTRTNGSLRATYGKAALEAARLSRYRCCECGYGDVRALNLDHVAGRTLETPYACLCANCHAIKSRDKDWSGEKRYAPVTAG